MANEVYENRVHELLNDIKKLIEVKGINYQEALADAGVSEAEASQVFSGKEVPGLTTFLALCEISGITFHLPSVETPNTPI